MQCEHNLIGFDLCPQTFAVCESLCVWGETVCVACPNPTTIITAGTSGVVCVWEVEVNKDKLIHMKLRQVSLSVCVQQRFHLNFYFLSHTQADLFVSTAVVRSHRHSDMPGCV